MDEDGTEKPFIMGCYGVGVSRSMAAVVEQYHDDNGICWPITVAPAHVCVVPLTVGDDLVQPAAEQLAEQLASDKESGPIVGLGVLDLPGCFAMARYGKIELIKDPTSYTGIYVGKDACVGEGIARTIAPTGNADVYADIKYKQNVWVYVFTCPTDKLDEKYDALVQLFAAGESYNRVEMGVTDEEFVEAE